MVAAFAATRERAAHRRGIDRHRRLSTDRAPSRPWSREVARAPRVERARGLPGSAERQKTRARPRRPALSQRKVLVGGRARKSLEPQSTPPLGRHRPPEDRLGQHGRARASRSRTWARSTSSSKAVLQGGRGHLEALAAVQHLKYVAGTKSGCALALRTRTRSIRDTGVCLGFS